ncbi:MAG: mprF [Panacagrimonas sp.]|jgi:phosphatidylglycerol lysyltransferase|nr:bifunctional lysylphosphatidylglycerol flippase/synthetase MprF [Panacagrimonas sp.]MCC2657010.1 mprF [Panacagrimonas sp.]
MLSIVALLSLLGVLSFEALRGLSDELSYAAVVDAIRATSGLDLLLALLATGISYIALTGYDHSALRYVGARVPYRVVGQTAFIAYALSNSVGLGVLTGGAVRLRLYSAAGVAPERVAQAIVFSALAFGIGMGVAGAVALLWSAHAVGPVVRIPAAMLSSIAAGFLMVISGAAVLAWRRGTIRLPGGRTIRAPSPALTMQQLLWSGIDIVATALVPFVLLPSGAIDFPTFLGFFCAATVLGMVSHLPGGIGVFEAVMLLALGGRVPAGELAGALLLYRAIYFVLPLVLALGWLVSHELRKVRQSAVVRAMVGLTPLLMAALTFLVGVMLLVSGVTPATDDATALLALHVPLILVEAAHFLGSVAGLALLFVARGMVLRLDAAWWTGVLLGLASLVLALPKGIAVSEAMALSGFVLMLIASRRQFTRRASLFAQPFDAGWTVAVGAVVAAMVALMFLVYRDVDYARELWWQFAFDAHAPRSLRALAAVSVLALVISLRQLFRPAAPPIERVQAATLERAAPVVDAQDYADNQLAMAGDKQFLFSEAGSGFVMYGRRGRSWIALFDPVGPASQAPELIWRFLSQAREAGGRAAFYQVRPDYLPLYLDAGLRLLKLGEHASVRLPEFTLKGSRRANLRHGVNRAEREGLRFDVVPREAVASRLDELRAVSDAWLAGHSAGEKAFSLGAFEAGYIGRQPVALISQGDRLVAFATLMTTGSKREASVDLMRHRPDAPNGTMDFLFVQLMLHFQAQGHERFSLGMAPLSGMAEHPLAPNWHRLGRLLFAHGESYYNFQGLRAFKEKFDPEWQPRYLAAPGGVAPLLVLADTAALIGGGLRTVIAR